MAEGFQQDRTEEATPRRREKARQEGRVAVSSELTNAIVLLVGLAMLRFGVGGTGQKLLELLRVQILDMHRNTLATPELPGVTWSLLRVGMTIVFPIVGAVGALGVASSLLQVGVLVTTEPLTIKWSKLSPTNGMSRLFSRRSVVRTAMMLLRIAISIAIVVWMLGARGELFAGLGRGSLWQTLATGWEAAFSTAMVLTWVYFALGAADYAYQRFQHEIDLRMTKQEIKDEFKETEGSIHTKGRMRKQQAEAAKQRMLLNVATATVVVTNPTHYAVALKYVRNSKSAPVVVAKGTDALARRIIRLAREHRVSVIERKPLARALYAMVEVNQEIPPELYKAIAQILAYIYGLRRRRRR